MFQPVTQKRLTNVAIVRLKTHGKRFEIAAYKNKVLNWREGIEKDINEVLQVITVFTNVSKGDVANDKDLKKVFGSTDQEEICRKILKQGELQVSDRERELQLEGLFRDIVQIVVDRCVHPQSGRQMTALAVENALKTTGFSVKSDQPAKKQALKAIESLCAEMPESFARAKMRLRITCPAELVEEIRRHLETDGGAAIEEEAKPGTAGASAGLASLTFLSDPSRYRELDRLCTVEYSEREVALHLVTSAVVGESAAAAASVAAAAAAAAGAGSPGAHRGADEDDPEDRARPQPPPAAPKAPSAQPAGDEEAPKKKGLRCSSCSAEFEDASVYRQHCRSDWHNHNLKRKVKNLAPVTEEEHAELALDLREGFLAVDS